MTCAIRIELCDKKKVGLMLTSSLTKYIITCVNCVCVISGIYSYFQFNTDLPQRYNSGHRSPLHTSLCHSCIDKQYSVSYFTLREQCLIKSVQAIGLSDRWLARKPPPECRYSDRQRGTRTQRGRCDLSQKADTLAFHGVAEYPVQQLSIYKHLKETL